MAEQPQYRGVRAERCSKTGRPSSELAKITASLPYQSANTTHREPGNHLTFPFHYGPGTRSIYRRPFCVVWAQLPLGKASGERGLAHRTHAHR